MEWLNEMEMDLDKEIENLEKIIEKLKSKKTYMEVDEYGCEVERGN